MHTRDDVTKKEMARKNMNKGSKRNQTVRRMELNGWQISETWVV